MPDTLTKEQRHHCMSNIHSKNTKPEILVRKELFKKGFRYRINVSKLPGKPDIVLPKYKTAIFINGCFWHGHEGCRHFIIPKTNTDYWMSKIRNNQHRDKESVLKLQQAGWKVLTIWECELTTTKFPEIIQTIKTIINTFPIHN